MKKDEKPTPPIKKKIELTETDSIVSFRLEEDLKALYKKGAVDLDTALQIQLVGAVNRLCNILDTLIVRKSP